MDKQVLKETLANLLDNARQELLAHVRRDIRFFAADENAHLLEQCLRDLGDFLRGRGGHVSEWMALCVHMVRDQGGQINEVFALIRAIRRLIVQFALERLEGVNEGNLLSILLDSEDQLLRIASSLYSEVERKVSAAEKRRQKAFAESMTCAFASLDTEGAITLVNSIFLNLSGFTESRLLGQSFLTLCNNETAAELRRDLRQRRGTNPRTFEGVLINSQSVRLPVRFRIQPIFDDDGFRSGIAVSITAPVDSTEAAGNNLPAKALERLANALDLGYCLTDTSGRIVAVNAAAAVFFTVGQEDGNYCCRQHLRADGVCGGCFQKRVVETGDLYKGSIHVKTVGGESRWLEITALPIRNTQGAVCHVVKLLRDITEHKILEDQVLHQQRSSLATQLAITVAHQLRNPLGIMIGFAEILSQGLPPEQVSVAVDKILRSGMRCKMVVENLLEFGRGLREESTLVNINEVIRERVQTIPLNIRGKELTWRLTNTPGLVECAPGQLVITLLHLIDTAIQVANRTIRVETDAIGEGTMNVRIFHDGPALTKEQYRRMFTPAHDTCQTDDGTGLAFSLCRRIIEDLGGHIYLDETLQEGVCFVIQLPVRSNRTVDTVMECVPELPLDTQRKVLVVEDEQDQLFLLTMALEGRGYKVDAATTGADGMSLMNQTDYDAIVVDILLGDGLGGRELFQILQNNKPHLCERTMFITGDTMKYETRRFLQETKRPVLEKPFMIANFTAEVEHLFPDRN